MNLPRHTATGSGVPVNAAVPLAPRAHAGAGAARRPARRSARDVYLLCLAWAFTFFAAARLFTYLPSIWAIHTSGASDQHSLLTWAAWFGANLTMGLWLHEQAGRRFDRAALVNLGNAAMCLATCIVIAWYR